MDYKTRDLYRRRFKALLYTCPCGHEGLVGDLMSDAGYSETSLEEDGDYEMPDADFYVHCPKCSRQLRFSVLYLPAMVTVYDESDESGCGQEVE